MVNWERRPSVQAAQKRSMRPMNKNMNLPAEYAVLSEEEMTYTQGGSDIGGFASAAATVVGAVAWDM